MKPDLSLVDPLDHHLATRVNVGDTLTRTAALFPDRVAIVDGAREVTFHELAETADRLGHALLGLGLEPGSPVALMMTNSWRMLATYYACARAGLVCLPLNVMLTAEDLAWITADAGTAILVVDEVLRAKAEAVVTESAGITTVVAVGQPGDEPQEVAGRHTVGWDALVESGAQGPLEVIVDERGAVQCLYTSGTTSRPKGVLTSHVSVTIGLLSNAIVTGQRWGNHPPVMLVVLPLFHVTALNTLAMPVLMMGGTVLLPGGGFNPATVLDALSEHRATHVMLLPAMYAACAAEQARTPRDVTSLEYAIYAMAPMPENLLAKVDEMFPNAAVILGSGQTEVVPATVMQWPEHRHTAAASWGPQVPSVLTRTMDQADGDVLGTGGTGEIVYRAPNVCLGYWNNPSANEQAFARGWFHSGDIGHVDGEGVVWFTDRVKDLIKSGGENVSSVAVEATVLAAPGVAECSVVGVPDERWGEAVCAVIVADGTVPAEEVPASVIEYAKSRLAGFQVPKLVQVVEELPKTATGKIQKYEVRARARES